MNQIQTARLDELVLDPRNPRLGLRGSLDDLPQADILGKMRSWALEEIAISFLENGFWIQEALLCTRESVYGAPALVVVEGNRRLAALKLLDQSFNGHPPSSQWAKIIEGHPRPEALFESIPYLLMEDRRSVDVFLGFRHVTGIKEWAPAEKAEYISFLIDERGLSYREVMRKIGSKTEAVRRNYISYRVFAQSKEVDGIDSEKIVERFSVLFLSLRAAGVQEFLGVDINSEPKEASTPVPQSHVDNLRDFVRWLFGTESEQPIVKDSRNVDRFAKVLQNAEAVSYLRANKRPSLEQAYVIAGGEEQELHDIIQRATYDVEQALSIVHLYKKSEMIAESVTRLVAGLRRIEAIFPDLDAG